MATKLHRTWSALPRFYGEGVDVVVEISDLRGYRDPSKLYLVTARGVATMGASLNMAVNLSNSTPWAIRFHIDSESRRRFNYKDENNGLSPITGHCPFNSLSQQILPIVFISLLLFLGFSFMSSRSSSADHRIVEVDGDFLPHPATKLVITQYLEASSDPPFWALIVVGAFFDQYDNTIWSTELFVAHLDIQLESDDSSEGEGEWESSGESANLPGGLYFYPCSFTSGPEDAMYFTLHVMAMNLTCTQRILRPNSKHRPPPSRN